MKKWSTPKQQKEQSFLNDEEKAKCFMLWRKAILMQSWRETSQEAIIKASPSIGIWTDKGVPIKARASN